MVSVAAIPIILWRHPAFTRLLAKASSPTPCARLRLFRTPDPECEYRLEYKEFPDDWADAKSIDIPKGQGSAQTSNVEALNPTSTYTLRLIAIKDGKDSEPSDELTVDTQGQSCEVITRLPPLCLSGGRNPWIWAPYCCSLSHACATAAPGCAGEKKEDRKNCTIS